MAKARNSLSYRPSYKVYTALLTQSGTNAPVATILENTLGDVTYSYGDVGRWSVDTDGLFLENKTVCFSQTVVSSGIMGIDLATLSPNGIVITQSTYSGQESGIIYTDGLEPTMIEIRVYE